MILGTACGTVTIAIGERKARVARNPVNTAPVYREHVRPTEFSMASLVDILISSASLQPVSLVTAVVLSGQLSSCKHKKKLLVTLHISVIAEPSGNILH